MPQREIIDESTYIDGFGKKLTIREFLQKELGKEVRDEKLVQKESKKFLPGITSGRSNKSAVYASQKERQKRDMNKKEVLNTKIFTPEEIQKEEEKMAETQIKKILRYLIANPKEWHLVEKIAIEVGLNPRSVATILGKMYKALQESNDPILKKRKTESGVMNEWKWDAIVESSTIADEWIENYNRDIIKWVGQDLKRRKEQKETEPKKRMVEKLPPLEPTVEEAPTEQEFREEVPRGEDRLDRLAEAVKERLGESNQTKIIVEIRVLFGFMK